jgi:EmrB/QacA subfamily drug resistance transporter
MPSAPSAAVEPSSRILVVATVMTGTIATILAATIVNVAFPALIRELGIGHDTLQWVSAGFLAATTATMLATAWLVGAFGERRTFIASLTLFFVASVLGASAWNAPALIAARIGQGAAAGILQPLAMIALFRAFPVHERGRAMGLYGFGIVLAPAIGPTVGGMLVDAFGWRSIFLLSVPFCVVGFAMGSKYLPASRVHPRTGFDWIGFVLLVLTLAALLNITVVAHRSGWLGWPSIATIATAAALTIAFVVWETRTTSPLLALRLFEEKSFVAATLVSFAYGLGLFGSTYLLPVFVQDIAAYSASQAGWLLLPPGLALAFALAGGGRLTDRVAPRYAVTAGLALFALSSLMLTGTGPQTAFWLLATILVVGRVGLGLIIPGLNVGAVQPFEGATLAYASAAVSFVRQLGGALGVNALAVLLEWRLGVHGPGGALSAFHESFIVVTIAFALALVPAWAMRRPRR